MVVGSAVGCLGPVDRCSNKPVPARFCFAPSWSGQWDRAHLANLPPLWLAENSPEHAHQIVLNSVRAACEGSGAVTYLPARQGSVTFFEIDGRS